MKNSLEVRDKILRENSIDRRERGKVISKLAESLSNLFDRADNIQQNDFDPPNFTSFSASEVDTQSNDADFDVQWSVEDPDGNLDRIELKLTDITAGMVIDDELTISISGNSASDVTRLVAPNDDSSGNNFQIDATAYDTGDKNDHAMAQVTAVAPISTLYKPNNWPNLVSYYPSEEIVNTDEIEDVVNGHNLISPKGPDILSQIDEPNDDWLFVSLTRRTTDNTLFAADEGSDSVYKINTNDSTRTKLFDATDNDFQQDDISGITWDEEHGWFWIIDAASGGSGKSWLRPMDESGAQVGNPIEFTTNDSAPNWVTYSTTRQSLFYRDNNEILSEVANDPGVTDPSVIQQTDLDPSGNFTSFYVESAEGEIFNVGSPGAGHIIRVYNQSDMSLDREITDLPFLVGGMSYQDNNEFLSFTNQNPNNADWSLTRWKPDASVPLVSIQQDGVKNTKAANVENTFDSPAIDTPSSLDPSGFDTYSISVWYYLTDKNTNGPQVAGGILNVVGDPSGGFKPFFVFGYNPGSSSAFGGMLNDSNSFKQVAGPDPATDTWHHAVLVLDVGDLTLYHNNVSQGTATSAGSVNTNAGNSEVQMGGSETDVNKKVPFNGATDEFMLWPDHALTSADVNNLYQKGV